MLVSTWSPNGTLVTPPPLWLVSDGTRTVGPVSTTALVHHVKEGHVPEHCAARPSRPRAGRAIDRIREVRAVRRILFGRARPDLHARRLETETALLKLSDGDDALVHGLRLGALALNAEVGFVHVFEGGHRPVTRHAFGPGADGRIGCPLLDSDIMAHVARTHCLAIGDVSTHHAFRVAGSRLGGRSTEVHGVAMVPVVARRGVVAMIELGRSGHAFRSSDAAPLRRLAAWVAERP